MVVEFNQITVRNTNLPLSANKFSEEFAGCAHFSLINFFLGYDKVKLDKESQDLTVFMTPLSFMQMTTLFQGATNFVAQFVQIILNILASYLQDQAKPFLDNLEAKGPKTKYNNKEIAPGIKRYIFKHIQNLDTVFTDLERARVIIA